MRWKGGWIAENSLQWVSTRFHKLARRYCNTGGNEKKWCGRWKEPLTSQHEDKFDRFQKLSYFFKYFIIQHFSFHFSSNRSLPPNLSTYLLRASPAFASRHSIPSKYHQRILEGARVASDRTGTTAIRRRRVDYCCLKQIDMRLYPFSHLLYPMGFQLSCRE